MRPSRDARRRAAAVFLPFVVPPVLFLGILYAWGAVDAFLGSREVSRFIRDHRPLIGQRLRDPRVHSLKLSHDPEHWGTLLIQFDVEDKAAYEMLESDLEGIWGMRFPPRWQTTMRSKERLENNFGYGVWGIGLAMAGLIRLLLAAIASVLASGLLLLVILRWSRSGPEPAVPSE